MKQRTFLAVIFMAAFLFLAAGISQLAVTDPVESNYALTALEMVRSGDWLSPQIYGTYWYDKPIFLYWLLSLSYSLLGTTDLAARLPAVLFGAASCTCVLVRPAPDRTPPDSHPLRRHDSHVPHRLVHQPFCHHRSACISSVALPCSSLHRPDRRKEKLRYGSLCHGSRRVLTKGPVGLVLPGLFLLLFIAIQRRPDYLKRLFPPVGIVLFLLLCLSWYGPMYNRHGMDFIDGLLGFNNVVRATVSEHPEYDVWYYYIVLVPVSLLPWTGPCLYGLWRRRSHRDEYVLMALWALGTILFYSLMATKYSTYAYIANWPLLYLGAARCRTGSTKTPAMPGWQPHPGFPLRPALRFADGLYGKNSLSGPEPALVDCLPDHHGHPDLAGLVAESLSGPALFPRHGDSVTYLIVTFQVLVPFYQYRSAQTLTSLANQGPVYFFEEYRTSYPYYTGQPAYWTAPADYDESARLQRDAVWAKKHVYPTEAEAQVLTRLTQHQSLTIVVPGGKYKDYKASKFFNLTHETGQSGPYHVFKPIP